MVENSKPNELVVEHFNGLRQQFQTFALKFPDISNFYVEYPPSDEPIVAIPSKEGIRGLFESRGTCESAHAIYLDGRWIRLRPPKTDDVRDWACWYEGDGLTDFDALADSADSLLLEHPIHVPQPCRVREMAKQFHWMPPDPIIQPYGPNRWVRLLHWLAWSGLVMPVSHHVWNGPIGLDSIQSHEQLYSPIDNLFLRSALAIAWIIPKLDFNDKTGKRDALKPRRKRGRPRTTNETEDRRIWEGWNHGCASGQYATYADCARAMGRGEDDIKAAVERQRKRQKKSAGGSRRGL